MSGGLRPLARWAWLGLLLAVGFGLLPWDAAAQPINDNFTNAYPIPNARGSLNGSNVGSTGEPGEPDPAFPNFPFFNTFGSSVWFSWVAPTNGVATFDTFGTRGSFGSGFGFGFGIDTTLGVYAGTNLTNLVWIGYNDDNFFFGFGLDSFVQFNAVAGTEYRIVVDGFFSFQGFYRLNWNLPGVVGAGGAVVPPVGTNEVRFVSDTFLVDEHTPGFIPVTVEYGGGSPGDVTVEFSTSDGTALVGTDYYGTSGTLTFAPGQSNQTFLVQIVDNANPDGNRTVNLTLANPTGGATLGIFTNAVLTILDNETIASANLSGEINFSTTNYTVTMFEGIAPGLLAGDYRNVPGALITVTRTGGARGRVEVDYSTTNNFLFDTNLFGTNAFGTNLFTTNYYGYTDVSGTLTFDDFQMSTNFIVPIYTAFSTTSNIFFGFNVFGFGNNQATLVLANPRAGAGEDPLTIRPTLGPTNTASLNVLDIYNNSASFFTNTIFFNQFGFERLHYRVDEYPRTNNNSRIVTVAVILPYGGASTVALQIGNNNLPLEPGSDYARPGIDFEMFPPIGLSSDGIYRTNLTSPPQSSFRRFVGIRILNDSLVEFNEDITVRIIGSSTFFLNSQASVANVTILYDDQSPGALDREWNPDEVSFTTPPFNRTRGANDMVMSVAVQDDGKSVLGGTFTAVNGTRRNYIARMNADGSLDNSFMATPNSGANAFVNSVLAYSTNTIPTNSLNAGKVLIGGGFTSYNGILRNSVARLNTNGTLDVTFNPGNGADGPIRAMIFQPDERIIVAGNFFFFNDIERHGLARLNPDGSLDESFNPGVGGDGTIWSLALYDDGTGVPRIMAGGDFQFFNDEFRGGIVRLNPDGTLDTTFNPGTGVDGSVRAIAVQASGQILVAGEFHEVDLRSRNNIARLNAEGTLDTTFDPGTGADDSIYAMVLGADERPFIGGIFTSYNETRRVGLARLKLDGTLDTTFMDTAYNQYAGVIKAADFETPNFINTIALQPDGNLIIGGSFTNVGGNFASEINEGGYERLTADPQELPIGSPVWGRAQKRNRYNIARLIGTWGFFTNSTVATNLVTLTNIVGGVTNFVATNVVVTNFFAIANPPQGPGNADFAAAEYTADENSGSLPVTLRRIDGALGTLGVVAVASDRLASDGVDYNALSVPSRWNEFFGFTRSDGDVRLNFTNFTVPILDDLTIEGDENVNLRLASPFGSINLGGEFVPLGGALGISSALMTIVDNDFDAGVFTFSSPTYSTNENAIRATITVVRNNGANGSVSVDYFTRNGTATAGPDYTTARSTLTFGHGVTTRTFTVPITADNTVEFDETVLLVLTNATGGAKLPGGLSTSSLTATLIIVDDDFLPGRLNFSANSFTNSENDGFATITVTRGGGNVGVVSVNFTNSPGANTSRPGDYTGTNGVLVWNDGDSSPKIFTIPLVADGQVEPNLETVTLTLFNSTPVGALGGVTNATLVIMDGDAFGQLAFTQPLYVADENGTNVTITIVRTGGIAGTGSVDFATSAGTATPLPLPGGEYADTNRTLVFLPGELSKSFTVSIADDVEEDGNKTVLLTLLNPTNVALGAISNSVLNIVDNESFNIPAGLLDSTFNPNTHANAAVNALALQPDGRLLIAGDFTNVNEVVRNRVARLKDSGILDPSFDPGTGPNAPIRAMALQPDGKAVIVGSFTNVGGINRRHLARLSTDGTLDTFFNPGAGADNPIFAVAVQGDEKILVGGAFNAFNGFTRPGIARLNTNGTLDATFFAGSGVNGIVYALAVQADGRILIGGEFTSINGSLHTNLARLFRNGTVDTTFNPAADAPVRAILVQPDGMLVVGGSFTSVTGGDGFSTNRNFLARFDAAGLVDTNFLDGQIGADNAVYALAMQADGRVVVGGDFSTFNGVTRNRLTRLNGDGSTDPTINFGDGANSFVSAIVIQPDRKIVIGGGFTTFDGRSRRYIARLHGGSISSPGAIEFTTAFFTLSESDTNALITVRRVGGTVGAISANFTNLSGTAVFGVHYSLATNEMLQFPDGSLLIFPEGETRQSFIITNIDDTVLNPDRTVNLQLIFTNAALAGPQPVARLTILDDESQVEFASATYSISEAAPSGTATITLVRTGDTNRAVTVDFMTTTNGTATSSPAPDADFAFTSGSLTFLPGEVIKNFNVPLFVDALIEGNETVELILANPVPTNSVALGLTNATLTIVDNNFGPGRFTFDPATYSVIESNTTVTVTVVRTNGSTGLVSVNYATSSGTATSGQDFISTNGILSFADGETRKTFTVRIREDVAAETAEFLTLRLFNATGGASIGLTNATLTIVDNEPSPGLVQFSTNAFFVREDQMFADILILRTNGSSSNITVRFIASNGTARDDADFVGTNMVVVFADGQISTNVQVQIIGNAIPHLPRTINLTLANPTGGAALGAPATATLTIADDDLLAGGVDPGFNALSGANGPVYSVVPSGDGRLLVGGDFTAFNGIAVNRLVRLDTNAVVDLSFNPTNGANAAIFGIAASTNGLVVVGGDFTTIGGTARNRVARLNTNGVPDLAFDPGAGPNDRVLAVAQTPLPGFPVGAASLIGGSANTNGPITAGGAPGTISINFVGLAGETNFIDVLSVTGVGTNALLAVSLTNNAAISLPYVAGAGSNLFIVVNAGRAVTNSWTYSGAVQTGLPGERQVVIGGAFTNVNGALRRFIARLNSDGTLDTNFNNSLVGPNGANGPVHAVTVQPDGKLLIGGDFTTVLNVSRPRVARLNADGSLDTSFNPGLGANERVASIALQDDGNVIIGGTFTDVAGAARNGVARLRANGTLDLTFDPGLAANALVRSVAVQAGGQVLVAGAFTSFNGQEYRRIVRLNPDGSVDASFNPGTGANDIVHSVAVLSQAGASSLLLPFADDFTFHPNNVSTNLLFTPFSVGTLDITATSLAGTTNNFRVYYEGIRLFDTNLAGAGAFSVPYIGVSTQIAVVVNEGRLLGGFWAYEGTNRPAVAIGGTADKVAIGGEFTVVNGLPRNRVAVLNGDGSVDGTFDPGAAANSTVYALGLYTNAAQPALFGKLVVGGDYSALVGVGLNRLARLNTNGTVDTTFNLGGSGPNNAVRAVALQPNGRVLVGGAFTSFNGLTNRAYLVRLESNGSLDSNFVAGASLDNAVSAIALQADGKAVIGGLFAVVGGITRNFIARVNAADGAVDPTFNPGLGANAPVRAVAIQPDGKIVIAGDFTTVNGQDHRRLARLHPNGSVDTSFMTGGLLGADGPINAVTLLGDGTILIGGAFTNYGGTARARLALVDTNGALVAGFAADPGMGANDYVSSLALQGDGRILVGGGYTVFNGLRRNRLTRLNPDGSTDATINFGTGANNFLQAIAVQSWDQGIAVGGGFTAFNDQPRVAIARLLGGTNFGAGTLQFVRNNFRVVENLGIATITVVRAGGATGEVTVALSTTDGTATSPPHYQGVTNQVLIFSPGETFQTVEIPVSDDSVTNVDRTLTLTLSNPTGDATNGSPSTATLTILDNDCVLGFTQSGYLVTESGVSARISVTRAGGATDFVTVLFASTNGTATPNLDYTNRAGVLVFSPGVRVQSFNIPVTVDLEVEGNETVFLNLFNATLPAVLGRASATLTILDNNLSPGVLSFSTNFFSASEADSNAVITVIRTNGSSGVVSVNFSTSNGSAMAGSDYDSVTGLLVFDEGETTKTFTVPLRNDTNTEGPETVNLTLSGPSSGASLGRSTAQLTIRDDDTPGTLVFGQAFYTVSETNGVPGGTGAVIDVRRVDGSLGLVTVTVQTGGGSAVPGTVFAPGVDYLSVTRVLIFTNGQTSNGFTITLTNDTVVEGIETIGLQLSTNTGGATIGGQATAVVNIDDDEVAFDFSAANYNVNENADGVTITVTRSGNTNNLVLVTAVTSDGSAQLLDADYLGTNAPLSFAPGVTSQSFIVTILNDTRVEGNQNINLSLQSQSPGTGIGTVRPTATISILDDDTGFSFSSPNYVVRESGNTLIPAGTNIFGFTNLLFGTNVTIGVIRQGGSNGVVSVEFETIDLGATGFDPATFAGDYLRVTNLLTFADGQTSSNLTISVFDDFVVEGDELVTLRLLNPQPSLTTSLGTQPTATLTIVDNDVSFGFSQTNYIVSEKVSPAVVTVVRRGLSTGDVSVVFTTRNGTAGAGSDYTTVSNVLTWTANDLSSRNVSIPVINDGNPEGLETVLLDLSNPTGGAFLDATNGAATLSIVDNAGSIAFTSSTYNGNESNGVANIMLARTGGSNGIVTVSVVVSNGTAIGGLDFTNTTGIVVAFANGEITKSFPIALINDSLAEGLETLTMSLRNPTGGALLGAPTNATLRIEDDEVNIIAAGSSLINESLMPTNNIIDPTETVTVRFALRNAGKVNTTNLTVTLLAGNGVTPLAPTTNVYGILVTNGASVSRDYRFTATGVTGSTITATLQLRDGSNDYGTVTFSYLLGLAAVPVANANIITINDSGPIAPFPATINVAGLGSSISKVTVSVLGLNHTFPEDIDMVVVGPQGQTAMLMSDVGGSTDLNNVTLTFDDDAPTGLSTAAIASGRFKPSNIGSVDALFPAPAPPGPYGTNLAGFNGSNPNGVWSLFIIDDNSQDGGSIVGGWSLTITTTDTVGSAADLSVTATALPGSAAINDLVTNTIVVTNHGPSTATGIFLTNTLPANATLAGAPVPAAFRTNGQTLVFNLVSLPISNGVTVTIPMRPTADGALTNIARVVAFELDPNTANNIARAVVGVGPHADVAVTAVAMPDPVAVGASVTNIITVTNFGPSTANGIFLTNTLPDGAALAEAPVPAAISTNGQTLVFNLGSLVASSGTSVMVVVIAPASSMLTNTARVAATEIDLDAGNNSTETIVSVTAPAVPLLVSPSLMLNHQFRLTLNGTPGQTYVLEAATNVTGPWTPISSVTLTTMTTNCVDPGATNFSQRFYRVLRMP